MKISTSNYKLQNDNTIHLPLSILSTWTGLEPDKVKPKPLSLL